MFMHQDEDPTPADEGKYISDAELEEWFKAMQANVSQGVSSRRKTVWRIRGAASMGQKLMTYFDDDPQKPMKCEVRGSRWVAEFSWSQDANARRLNR